LLYPPETLELIQKAKRGRPKKTRAPGSSSWEPLEFFQYWKLIRLYFWYWKYVRKKIPFLKVFFPVKLALICIFIHNSLYIYALRFRWKIAPWIDQYGINKVEKDPLSRFQSPIWKKWGFLAPESRKPYNTTFFGSKPVTGRSRANVGIFLKVADLEKWGALKGFKKRDKNRILYLFVYLF
jgi:hypothetical protein